MLLTMRMLVKEWDILEVSTFGCFQLRDDAEKPNEVQRFLR